MKGQDTKAFTLIELLVVIVILAILAAIFFPVFVSAKEAAKQTQCMSNMRQYAIAFQVYKTDWDDVNCPAKSDVFYSSAYPRFQWWVSFDNSWRTLPSGARRANGINEPLIQGERPGSLDSYVKTTRLKVCPMQKRGAQSTYAVNGFGITEFSNYYDQNPLAKNREYGPFTKDLYNSYQNIAASGSEEEEPSELIVMHHHNDPIPACPFVQGYDWEVGLPDFLASHMAAEHRKGRILVAAHADTRVKAYPAKAVRRWFFSCQRTGIYPNMREPPPFVY